MKYRVLLLGMNKVIIDEFFEHLQDSFDAQTTTFRRGDMDCHVKYLKPDAIIFCMHNETPENVHTILDYKYVMQDKGIPLVIVGSQKECDDFEKLTHHMSSLVLTKPISFKGIKEKVYEFMESRNVSPHADDEQVQPEMVQKKEERSVDQLVEQVMASSISVSMEEQIKRMVESASGGSSAAVVEIQSTGAISAVKETVMTQPVPSPDQPIVEVRTAQPSAEQMPPVVSEPESVEMPSIAQTSYTDEMQRKIAEMVQKELHAAEEKQKEEPVQPQVEAPPAKKHVLVVDDDPMMLKLIKEQLKDNYAVGTAVSGNLAMKFLENKKTDLIILDYEMPLENGAMVLKRIRRNPDLAKLPVIFLTGVSDRAKIKQVVDLKPQGYLLKPIEKEQLLAIIKKTIG